MWGNNGCDAAGSVGVLCTGIESEYRLDWWGDTACRARIKSQKLTAHPPSLGQRRCAWSTAARETRGPCRAGWKYNCRMAAGQQFATTNSMMLPPPWSAARWVGPSFWACRLQGLSFCCNCCNNHHFSNSLPLQLGLSSAGFAVGNAAFGEGTGPIAWDGVKCTGSEATIQQCRRSPTIDCASSMLQVGSDWWCCVQLSVRVLWSLAVFTITICDT